MPCDTKLKAKQTLQQRAEEVRSAVRRISDGLVSGQIKPKIGPQGAIAFVGLTDDVRDGVTDNCIYRRLMVDGSALARAAITRAEQLAGKSVSRNAMAMGIHSHDGGNTWHTKG